MNKAARVMCLGVTVIIPATQYKYLISVGRIRIDSVSSPYTLLGRTNTKKGGQRRRYTLRTSQIMTFSNRTAAAGLDHDKPWPSSS